jgi:class 3 adenylate cyclase/tetratricopeptide (TPR) repeat protein
MSLTCPTCGTSLGPDSRFCGGCGTPQPGRVAEGRFATPIGYTPPHLVERILRHRSALEGEHKRVTVLFCDLVGSTPLAQRLGPEVMHEVLDRFFEEALVTVHLYEGTVNQFLGDGFMALFGAPLAIEHHERQALLAAVGLRDEIAGRLRDVERRIGEPLRIRLGVNTGDVVVGKIGDNLRMDYTAVGDTTNVAARLERMAGAAAIIASATTYERAQTMFSAEPLGQLDLAGRADPVTAYRIVARLPSRSPLEPDGQRALSPFVGRERALAALLEALAQAEAERGQVVGVIGDPGLGKSRLLAELRGRLAGQRLTWLEGRCVSYGATIPYLPILDLLRANARIVDTDTPAVIEAKIRAALTEVELDPDTSAPPLIDLLGVKTGAPREDRPGPEAMKARTFDLLRELALRGSRRRPIVFVVEDLHWIDQASLDFLMELADTVAGSAMLFIVTYRPGFSPPWAGKSYATQIALRPLGVDESLTVIDAALGDNGLATDARRVIAARGEGNPFFLEELVRVFVQPGTLPLADRIPDTLQGLLMSRIDRLPDETKRTLQVASVMGREFSPQLLEVVVAQTRGLEERLRELVRHEFLRHRAAGERPYVFNHALTRDVVYGSLLERHRRQYHTLVGRGIERLHAGRLDEMLEVLAHHFGAGDEDDPAVDYAMRAAVKAQRRWANAEALAYADAALRRLKTMADTAPNRLRRIDTVIQQAEVRFALGQHAEHIAALQGIEPLIESEGDPARQAAWHYWVGFLHSLTGGRPEIAIEHCGVAVAIAEREHLEEIGAYADACLAQAYHVAGELASALAAGDRALAAFERRGNVWWTCRALAHLSAIANSCGDWPRSLECCERILAHGETLDNVRLKASALVRLASTYIQQGEWATGLTYCEQALSVEATPYDAAAVRAIRGYGLLKAGRVDEGVAELSAAVAWYRRSSLRYTHAQFSLWLAEGYMRQGDWQRGQRGADGVRTTSHDLGYRGLEGVAERLVGECIAAEDVGAAITHLARAEQLLETIGARGELARALLARARVLETLGGDPTAAGESRRRAREMFTALGMHHEEDIA